jgi:hypothetical protein
MALNTIGLSEGRGSAKKDESRIIERDFGHYRLFLQLAEKAQPNLGYDNWVDSSAC